jgi:hypothetical protein
VAKYERYAVPAVFIIFAATLAPWAYNFPLNDDWAYATAVRTLTETGRLALSDWGSSTQVLHIIIGSIFCKFFGFSLATLRVTDVAIAAAALFVFVKILDEFEIGSFEKLAAGLAMALNPIYLVLANSFMTDIHYLLWMFSAVYFYVKRLKDPEDSPALVWAGVCAAAAYLTRQLAIALPLAFTLTLLLQGRFKWKTFAAVWVMPAAAMLGYYLWFTRVNGPTWASENYVAAATLAHLSSPLAFFNDSVYRFFASMVETGFLLLPLAAGYLFSVRQFHKRNSLGHKVNITAIWLAFGALAVFAALNGPLPYLENTLARSGFGVLTLGGAQLKPDGLFASQAFWLAATAASLAAAIFLIASSGLALRAGKAPLRFVFSVFTAQFLVSLLGAKYFDRYLLATLLPWFAIAAVFASKGVRFSRSAAALALVLCASLSWAGTKDYLAWNNAKWELAARPHAQVPSDEIVNGFDYEAWFNYDRNMAYLKSMKPLNMIGEWEWQKLIPFKAEITFSPDPRMKVVDKTEYSTPLSARKGVLYLLTPKS